MEKSLETIYDIMSDMSNERFTAITNAENDYWSLDARTSRNGYKRLKYNLEKEGLTIDDYFRWCE